MFAKVNAKIQVEVMKQLNSQKAIIKERVEKACLVARKAAYKSYDLQRREVAELVRKMENDGIKTPSTTMAKYRGQVSELRDRFKEVQKKLDLAMKKVR